MRIIYFILILIAGVTLPWWLVLPLWAVYAFAFGGCELLPLGLLLDAYFGYGMWWQIWYTASAAILCIGMDVLRPRLVFSDVHR